MRISIILGFLLISFTAFGQKNNFSEHFLPITENKTTKSEYHFTANSGNPLDFILANLFVGYKKFVSSQDISSCNFEPSCSVYAVQAIKKQGIVVGSLNFFDRFARCNPLSPEFYEKNYQKRLLKDPLRNIKNEIILE